MFSRDCCAVPLQHSNMLYVCFGQCTKSIYLKHSNAVGMFLRSDGFQGRSSEAVYITSSITGFFARGPLLDPEWVFPRIRGIRIVTK